MITENNLIFLRQDILFRDVSDGSFDNQGTVGREPQVLIRQNTMLPAPLFIHDARSTAPLITCRDISEIVVGHAGLELALPLNGVSDRTCTRTLNLMRILLHCLSYRHKIV